MSIKKILSLFFVLIPLAVSAQNFRTVRGSVYDIDGVPLPVASITYPGNTEKYKIESNGNFIIQIPQHVRYLTAELEGYIPVTVEVDGAYMVFKLKVDKKYYENKAKAEAEAKALAEREAAAKAQAEADAKAAAEKAEAEAKAAAEKAEAEAKAKAEREAAAKAKAEAEAKAAAEKAEAEAKLKAEKEAAAKAKAEAAAKAAAEKAEAEAKAKAEREAAAKAKAEEQAKIEAEKRAIAEEQARLKAEEEARLEAIRKAKADSVAKVKAEVQNRRKEISAAYNKAYRNKGFTQSIEISYAYPMHEPMRLVYENLGYRTFTTLHPIEATYTLGYRFCNWVALSVGSGIFYETVDLRAYGDKICHDLYKGSVNETEDLTNFSVPAFLNLRLYLSRGKVQPMISLTGGAYLYSFSDIDVDPMADAGLGANFRLGRWCNVYLLASLGMIPVHDFSENNRYARNTVLAPRVKLGFNF